MLLSAPFTTILPRLIPSILSILFRIGFVNSCYDTPVVSWLHLYHQHCISLYGPTPWTKFRPPYAPKMGTYVSREFSLDTEFTRTYVCTMYCKN